jgi:hypothetical protein
VRFSSSHVMPVLTGSMHGRQPACRHGHPPSPSCCPCRQEVEARSQALSREHASLQRRAVDLQADIGQRTSAAENTDEQLRSRQAVRL